MDRHDFPNDTALIWGSVEIGRAIGRGQRSTARLLRAGRITAAKRIGHRWTVSRAALARQFEA